MASTTRRSPAASPPEWFRCRPRLGGEHIIATHVTQTADDVEADTRMAEELAASHWYGTYRRPEGY